MRSDCTRLVYIDVGAAMADSAAAREQLMHLPEIRAAEEQDVTSEVAEMIAERAAARKLLQDRAIDFHRSSNGG
jgi:hypothetical protein